MADTHDRLAAKPSATIDQSLASRHPHPRPRGRNPWPAPPPPGGPTRGPPPARPPASRHTGSLAAADLVPIIRAGAATSAAASSRRLGPSVSASAGDGGGVGAAE